ncbi:hypothetical protein P12x_000682 [Tundrisphaera lichenicola]|uniref:hypothetical protein n=1 Tax=Tundrisphaera lichenicola TaxID=2029860 RepID=UPI003EBBDED8
MSFSTLNDSDLASLPPSLDEMIRAELADDEKLLWVGRPRASRIILPFVPISIFGIFFGGFALFWIAMASHAPWPFALFGIPFVLIGLTMITSPFWGAFAASKICYALTNRRAITWEPSPWAGTQIRSYGRAELTSIARNQRGDGSGDLIFQEFVTYGRRGRTNVTRRGFFGIDRVREVENLIRTNLPGR